MQHVIVTATPEITEHPVTTSPVFPKIYRDDQFIRFSLGENTEWDTETVAIPIVFGEGWPGGPVAKDVPNLRGDTYVTNGNTPLPVNSSPQTYDVTYHVIHVVEGVRKKITHDPEVGNEPQP